MNPISVKIDLIDIYNAGSITDEMLVALLFGDEVFQGDGVSDENGWKLREPNPDGFVAFLNAFDNADLDAKTHKLFDAIKEWIDSRR